MKRKKVIVIISTLVIVGAISGAGYYFREDIQSMVPFLNSGSSEDRVYVEKLSAIMNQGVGISNRYNGIVESQDTYEVNVDSSQTIKDIYVEVGDTVDEGQELAAYDTSEAEMQIKLAELDLESMNNEIASNNKQIEQLTYEMSITIDEEERFSYSTEIQTIQNTIAQSLLDLEAKNLEIDKLRKQVADAKIISKQGGVVKEINESGTDSNGNTAPFMTILQEGEYRVKGAIDEQTIWMIEEGQQVLIRSRVDADKTWSGKLLKVDKDNIEKGDENSYNSSDSAQSSTKYPFYVELESADGLLLGQHVYIEMDEGQETAKQGVWLYSYYIIQEDTGAYVWAADEKNRIQKRYVELGEYDAGLDEYEIVSGLAGTDYIAYPMAGMYEGVTAVTDAAEVDYESPLYNQDSTELPDADAYPGVDGGEMPDRSESLFEMNGTESLFEMNGTESLFRSDGAETPLRDAVPGTEVEE